MVSAKEQKFMKLALELALKGRGFTKPNPLVGAILVKNNRIVGKGYHKASGNDHAEIAAIRNAGKNSVSSTLYVNLEPCCHKGKTGPCTDAIVEAGISKVVFSLVDPNPLVKGKGARKLRNAGIEVGSGLLRKEAQQLNDIYLGYQRKKRPYVILKTAQSIDGRIATTTGESKWITGSGSLDFSHRLRSEVDAIVVGMGTVRKDNPNLTVRNVKGINPYRIVLTNSIDFPKNTNLLEKNKDMKTIVATNVSSGNSIAGKLRNKNLIVWKIKKSKTGELDLHDLIDKAEQFGIRSLLVEGGAKLITSFLKERIVDKYCIISAPIILGAGIESIGNLNISKLTKAIKFSEHYNFQLGCDNLFVGYPQHGAG